MLTAWLAAVLLLAQSAGSAWADGELGARGEAPAAVQAGPAVHGPALALPPALAPLPGLGAPETGAAPEAAAASAQAAPSDIAEPSAAVQTAFDVALDAAPRPIAPGLRRNPNVAAIRRLLRDPFAPARFDARTAEAPAGGTPRLYALSRPLEHTSRLAPTGQVIFLARKALSGGLKFSGIYALSGSALAALGTILEHMAPLPVLVPLKALANLEARYEWHKRKGLARLARLPGVTELHVVTAREVELRFWNPAQSSRGFVFLQTSAELPPRMPHHLLLDPPSVWFLRAYALVRRAGALRLGFVRGFFARDRVSIGDPVPVPNPDEAKLRLSLNLGKERLEAPVVWEAPLRQILAKQPIPGDVAGAWRGAVERYETEAAAAKTSVSLAAWYLRHFTHSLLHDVRISGSLERRIADGLVDVEPLGVLAQGKAAVKPLGMTHWHDFGLHGHHLSRLWSMLAARVGVTVHERHIPVTHVAVQDKGAAPATWKRLLLQASGRLILR